ncbi:MAG: hypothetical protein A2W19_14355 [Spirochaetes bacterium RBG_16_49_21]|nr:MAG: hypothetical protein A2W19_14355 [Spirochaetes bacterium RBG_16_49_21]
MNAAVSCLLISFTLCGKSDHGFAVNRESVQLNEAALLLAGKDLPKDSKIYPYTQTAFYRSYKEQINGAWNRFQKPNLQKIKDWWRKYGSAPDSRTVLYPFSGPDIMNALVFFPDNDTYILFGLEPPGVIPAPGSMSTEEITRGLNGLKSSLGDILRMNFFKTEGMAAELSSKSFNSITGLIMYFLATNGCTLLNVRKIAIDAQSNLDPGTPADERIQWQNPPRSRVPGVEISFKKNSGKVQIIRYFMLNVIDYALTAFSPNFIPYLKKEGPFATIIKSASYLMHNDTAKFTQIRAAILAETKYLLQDDSGIPLRYFKPDQWKLGFHGYYDQPIGLFSNRMQPDLKKAMAAGSTGPLPFSYGYDCKPGQSNLMTAQRIK